MVPLLVSKLSSFPFWVTIGIRQDSTTGRLFCVVKKNIDMGYSKSAESLSRQMPIHGTNFDSRSTRLQNSEGNLTHCSPEELRYSRYLNVYNRIVEHPPIKEEAESTRSEAKIVEYDIVGVKTSSFHFCAVFPYDSLTKSVTLIREYAQGGNCYMYGVPCGGLSEKHTSLEDCARKELSEERLGNIEASLQYDDTNVFTIIHLGSSSRYPKQDFDSRVADEFSAHESYPGCPAIDACGSSFFSKKLFFTLGAILKTWRKWICYKQAQLQGGKLVKLISDDHPGLLEVKWCRIQFIPFLLLHPECAFDFQKQSQVGFTTSDQDSSSLWWLLDLFLVELGLCRQWMGTNHIALVHYTLCIVLPFEVLVHGKRYQSFLEDRFKPWNVWFIRNVDIELI
eukprot:Gb_39617 [translate_table: standard]